MTATSSMEILIRFACTVDCFTNKIVVCGDNVGLPNTGYLLCNIFTRTIVALVIHIFTHTVPARALGGVEF